MGRRKGRKAPRESRGDFGEPRGGAKAAAPRPPGLLNLGNTCYCNAVLQCLAGLPAAPSAATGALAEALQSVLERLRAPRSGKGSVSPASVLELVRQEVSQFRGRQQQDAHELLVHLLELLGDAHPALARSFAGQTVSTVKCQACATKTFTREDSLSVSLEIPGAFGAGPRGRRSAKARVQEAKKNPFTFLDNASESSDSDEGPVSPKATPATKPTGPKLSQKEKLRLKRRAKRAKKRQKEAALEDRMEQLAVADPVGGPSRAAEEAGAALGTTAEAGEASAAAAPATPSKGMGESEAPREAPREASCEAAQRGVDTESLGEDGGGENGGGDSAAMGAIDEVLATYDPPVETSTSALAEAAAATTVTLRQCLEAYCKKERLRVDDGNGFRCDPCGDGTSDAWKRFALLRCPQVLVLHLKRLFVNHKVTKRVLFDTELDVTSFCMTPPGVAPPVRYCLVGVVEHSGSADGGHYTAYVDVARRRARPMHERATSVEVTGDGGASQGDVHPGPAGSSTGGVEAAPTSGVQDAVASAGVVPGKKAAVEAALNAMVGAELGEAGETEVPGEEGEGAKTELEGGVGAGPAEAESSDGAGHADAVAVTAVVPSAEYEGELPGDPGAEAPGEAEYEPDWYHMSDTSVRAIEEKFVLRAQAYMLFYMRM